MGGYSIMRIMGIDPSLSSTGVGVVIDGKTKYWEAIKSSIKEGYTEDRIVKIVERVQELCKKWEIDYIVIEKPIAGAVNGVRTIQDLAGLYYTIACSLMKRGYLVVPCMPSEWKSTVGVVGKKRAEQKKSSVEIASRHIGKKLGIKDNDIADAILIGIYGSMLEVERSE